MNIERTEKEISEHTAWQEGHNPAFSFPPSLHAQHGVGGEGETEMKFVMWPDKTMVIIMAFSCTHG